MTFYNGATSQIRTGDPRITSAMLWPAELKWQMVTPTGIEPMSPPWKGDVLTSWPRGLKYKEPNKYFLFSSLYIRPVGQEVKTPPFHGGDMGSIPVRVTNII